MRVAVSQSWTYTSFSLLQHNYRKLNRIHCYHTLSNKTAFIWQSAIISCSLISLQQVNPGLEGTAQGQGSGGENLLGPDDMCALGSPKAVTQESSLCNRPTVHDWFTLFSVKTQWLFTKFCNFGTLSFVYFSPPIRALWPVLHSDPLSTVGNWAPGKAPTCS